MKKIILFLVVSLLGNVAVCQHVTLNDSVDSFGLQVATLLERTNNSEAAAIGQDFNALWPNSFSSEQQSLIIELAVKIQKEKYASIPYHRDFFGALTSGVTMVGLSENILDNFLDMLLQSFEKNSRRNFARELVNLRTFFEKTALHYSRFNSLYVSNVEFDFEFAEAASQSFEDMLIEGGSTEGIEEVPEEETWEEENEDGWGDDNESGWGDEDDDGWGDENDDGWGDEGNDGWGDSTEEEDDTSWSVSDEGNDGEALELSFDSSVLSEDAPELEGAIIKFSRVDLILVSKYDSTVLTGTSGNFMLDKFVFVGEGGRFDWSAAGFDPAELYVELEKYNFNTRNPYLEANNAKLFYPDKVPDETKGHFEFKSVKHDSTNDAKYPRFISYENNIELKNMGDDNLKYVGGMALEGRKLIGASVYGRDSRLEYSDDNGKRFKTQSKLFNFSDSMITSYNSKVAIYHGRDSITHPSVKSRFYTGEKRFVAIKDGNGYNIRPFNTSHFNMTIEADIVDWDMKSDSMNISILNAKSLLPAYFKSAEYYDFEEIKELTGVYNFNPLLVVYSYGTKVKSREFFVSDLIQDLGLNEKAVRGAMMHLLYLDYIEYDEIGGRIYLKDKALHFVRSKNNKKDFDDLLIPSLSTYKPNATLHLESNELSVRGIEKFFISEILDVYIYPRDNEIKLLENRDFKFDGQLFAGNFEFVGRNFTFRYDSFMVDLVNIDSVKFYIDGDGQNEKKQVDNKLVSLELSKDDSLSTAADNSTSGTLYINRPDNKSGRKIFPQYPIFNADRGAIVYFDTEETLDGAYDKSVYFTVPPFGIDSLSSSDPSTIGFDGTFVTGGILPEFKEKLKIMPDNSLGFEHIIPQDGFELYGGPGKLYNKVQLDKNGLVAAGKIDYLTSSSYSENYVLYLDSMISEGTNFKIEQGEMNGIIYPDIYSNNFDMKWIPSQDHMYVSNKIDSFKLYNNSAALTGTIDLTTQGVKGSGTMTTRGFISKSDYFSFSETNLMANHSFFKLASENPEKPLLQGEDIRLEFDFSNDIADISPEIEGMAAIDFPYAQIKTSISNAKWNLKEQKVHMTKPPDVALENSYFYATRKELDSLAFNAEAAEYDIQTSELRVSGIPYIIVGDAMITPENNEVLILENAQIGELTNTTIVIDTLNEYHRLVNGTITIHSRTEFSGDAAYEYVNTLNDTFNIKFGKFDLWKDPQNKKDQLQTVANGMISDDNKMRISEGMFYKGDVTMFARRRALELDGFVHFDLANREQYTWIKYASTDEETQDVMFDYKQAITENGESLNAGLHYGSLDNGIYTTFAEEKRINSDEDFFQPDGIVYFNSEKGMFMVEDTAKSIGGNFSGKVFGYNDKTGDVEFEGPINFVENTSNASLTASGFGSGNANEGIYQLNSLLKFDYKLPEQALALMAADLFEVIENFGAPEAENDPDAFLYKVSEIIGERATEEYDKRNQVDYIPIASFTSKMEGSLVFSKVDMEWSPVHNAWYSKDKVGLSNILKSDLNALIDGFIEIKRTTETGTVMNIFIQASSDCWYYFGFEDNRLMIYSSNDEFVDIIAAKSNIDKAGFGEYVFVNSDLPDVLKYVDRFRLNYLGIEDPYEITMPVEEITENLDFLVIPVDNTEDGDVLPMEVEDNTEESLISDDSELQESSDRPEEDVDAPEVSADESDSSEPAEDQPKRKKRERKKKSDPQEEIAEPVKKQEKIPVDEDDDEGF